MVTPARSLLITLLIVVGLIVYALAVMRFAVAFLPDNLLAELVYYLVFGIAWVWPASWLMRRIYGRGATTRQP